MSEGSGAGGSMKGIRKTACSFLYEHVARYHQSLVFIRIRDLF